MPNYDPKKNGWTTLFITSGAAVTVPEQLTKKWWDKNKQTIAKTHATGINDLLEPLQRMVDACDWQRFPGNPTALEGNVKQMKAFMTSNQLKSLREQFKQIRDTAKKEAVHFRKSSLTKKTAEVLDEIESVADCLFVCTNPASLADMYKKAEEDYEALQLDKAKKNAGPSLNSAKLVIKKLPAAKQEVRRILEKVKENPEQMIPHGKEGKPTQARSAWGGKLRDLCRDITQPLGNLLKARKAGTALTDFDDGEVEKLYNDMSKISNTKSQSEFCDKLNGNQCEALTKKLESWCDQFEDLLGDTELGA